MFALSKRGSTEIRSDPRGEDGYIMPSYSNTEMWCSVKEIIYSVFESWHHLLV